MSIISCNKMSGQGNKSYIHLELIFDIKSLPGNFLAGFPRFKANF